MSMPFEALPEVVRFSSASVMTPPLDPNTASDCTPVVVTEPPVSVVAPPFSVTAPWA